MDSSTCRDFDTPDLDGLEAVQFSYFQRNIHGNVASSTVRIEDIFKFILLHPRSQKVATAMSLLSLVTEVLGSITAARNVEVSQVQLVNTVLSHPQAHTPF